MELRKVVGRLIGIGVVAGAVVAAAVAVQDTNRYPRTDDANVRANLIEIAPEVNGRLIELAVKDNTPIKKGAVLFAIDSRPYEYALQQALSDQEALEQQIVDTRRRISAQGSAVDASRRAMERSTTDVKTTASGVDAAKAAVTRAKSAVTNAEAQLGLANNNLHRIEPLL